MLADLHMHSTVSDGWFEPTDVVGAAAQHGVELVALSDHDSFLGVDEARTAALGLGLRFLTAVEVSTFPQLQMRHILGHGVDPANPQLLALLARNQQVWTAETLAVIEVLAERGVDTVERTDLFAVEPVMPNRVARLVVQRGGEPAEIWDCIHEGLERVRPEVYDAMATPAEAVAAIRGAGGLAVAAHPGVVPDQSLLDEVLPLVDGLEVYSARHSPEQVERYEDLARRHALLPTVGTDYHGYLGALYVPPSLALDERYLRAIQARIAHPLATVAIDQDPLHGHLRN